MIEEYLGKYIGPNKIKDATISEEKTYFGNEMVDLIFEDDSKVVYPKKMCDLMITPELSDLSGLREKRVIPIVQEIIALLAESELTKNEIGYIMSVKLIESLNLNIDRAMDKVFNKNNAMDNITFKDIYNILK